MKTSPTADPPAIAVIGLGRAGRDIVHLARRSGVPVTLAWDLASGPARIADVEVPVGAPPTIQGELVILAVPDGAIEAAARELGERGAIEPGACLAHLSGATLSRVLHAAGGDHPVVAMHPLQTFLGDGAAQLPFPWVLEGDDRAVDRARTFVDTLGCTSVRLPAAGKARYHAAATMASNLLLALLGMVERQAAAAGLPREELPGLFLPLMEATLSNAARRGTTRALTGPVQRGDVDTVRAHLRVLADSGEDRAAYARLSLQLLHAAVENGLDGDTAETLQRLLTTDCCPRPDGG